jgi:predicted MPP superfamily phosphohydrolase
MEQAEDPLESADPVDHVALRDRLGLHLYRQRINVQTFHASQRVGQGQTLLHPENIALVRKFLEVFLKATFLWKWGYSNARDIQVREVAVPLRRLPESFRGFRILQLSDLHLDLDAQLADAIMARLTGLTYDLCVMTGDFRAETHGDRMPAIDALRRLVPFLTPSLGAEGLLAILGNHDDLEMTAHLEACGVRVLLNESVAIRRGAHHIDLVGIDDPHFYETADFERALHDLPLETTKILLSHTAESYRKALACGIDYMLCGHTHGGQICLPGGIPIWRNARHPGYMARGAWQFHDLRGYTSAGTGCSMVPVRFFCPPEMTIHVLDRASAPPPTP